MPRLGHMIVDGLALVLVGAGLIAVVAGYQRNLPSPVSDFASQWSDPVTTGSIAPAPLQPRWRANAMSQPRPLNTRPWTDTQDR